MLFYYAAQRPVDSIQYIKGKIPIGRKPKRSDYEKPTQVIIDKACDFYNLKLITVNAFPLPEFAKMWAKEAWVTFCNKTGKIFSANDSSHVHNLVGIAFLCYTLTDYVLE
jgi:hypothetical protein